MEEYLNKKVKILIAFHNDELFYYATITNVSDTHISFIDKFGKKYTYLKTMVIQIAEGEK